MLLQPVLSLLCPISGHRCCALGPNPVKPRDPRLQIALQHGAPLCVIEALAPLAHYGRGDAGGAAAAEVRLFVPFGSFLPSYYDAIGSLGADDRCCVCGASAAAEAAEAAAVTCTPNVLRKACCYLRPAAKINLGTRRLPPFDTASRHL